MTVHCSDTLHRAHPPVERPRKVVYSGFGLPPLPGDVITPDPRYSREARAELTSVQDRIEAADNQDRSEPLPRRAGPFEVDAIAARFNRQPGPQARRRRDASSVARVRRRGPHRVAALEPSGQDDREPCGRRLRPSSRAEYPVASVQKEERQSIDQGEVIAARVLGGSSGRATCERDNRAIGYPSRRSQSNAPARQPSWMRRRRSEDVVMQHYVPRPRARPRHATGRPLRRSGPCTGGGRRSAVALTPLLGGKLESFYFAFGDDDVIVIGELPDNETAGGVRDGGCLDGGDLGVDDGAAHP